MDCCRSSPLGWRLDNLVIDGCHLCVSMKYLIQLLDSGNVNINKEI